MVKYPIQPLSYLQKNDLIMAAQRNEICCGHQVHIFKNEYHDKQNIVDIYTSTRNTSTNHIQTTKVKVLGSWARVCLKKKVSDL